jgi:hypothetical protein
MVVKCTEQRSRKNEYFSAMRPDTAQIKRQLIFIGAKSSFKFFNRLALIFVVVGEFGWWLVLKRAVEPETKNPRTNLQAKCDALLLSSLRDVKSD